MDTAEFLSTFFMLLLVVMGMSAVGFGDQVFYPVQVSTTDLGLSTTMEAINDCRSELLCAMQSTAKNWSYLFCFPDQECSLYDLKVHPLSTPASVPVEQCWTKIDERSCLLDGTIYQEGFVKTDPITCKAVLCVNGNVQITPSTAEKPTTCEPPFQDISDVGCIYLMVDQTVDQCAAQDLCDQFGATLVDPQSFAALAAYLRGNMDGNDYWAAIKSRKWFDGRDVAADEWEDTTSQPNGDPDECGVLSRQRLYLVEDRPCVDAYKPLCQLNL